MFEILKQKDSQLHTEKQKFQYEPFPFQNEL